MRPRKAQAEKQVSTDVLDAQGAAWFVGAHVETLRRLARKGEIPAYKVGKDWRFSRGALEEWMRTHHVRQRPARILVVDDEPLVRKTLYAILRSEGYEVAMAEDGHAAIELVRQSKPDLVILDLVMPGKSGAQTLCEMRAMHPDISVLILTGYPDIQLAAEALCCPPVTILPKPADKALILQTVGQMLNGTMNV